MTSNDVCGVIVTFSPGNAFHQNVAAILPQVDALVVIDDGSPMDALAELRALREELRFVLIENGCNRGVAAALNTGVRWALSHFYDWVVLFDQDSTSSNGMVEEMVRQHELTLNPEKVAIVMPKHIEKGSGAWIRPSVAHDGSPLIAITSGSLIPKRTFDRCGEFEEDLFIDCVDDEYCLRARSLGYTICLCEKAILFHAVGAPKARPFLGIRTLTTLNHGAERRYYIARNNIVVVRRYWKTFPRWCLNDCWSWAKEFAKVALVERDRRHKLSMIALGIFDGLRGRLGPVVRI